MHDVLPIATRPRAPVRPPLAASVRGWLLWAALVHGLLLAVFLVNRPIPPRGQDAPAQAFSEARARKVLHHLTNDIGLRLAGTAGAERAAADLAARLRAIPGVEVDVQHVEDARLFQGTFVPWPLIAYRVTNVVARIPGRSRDAILLDAHYDTLGDSPGAGDDGLGVAAMVESARALAAGPQLERSVIILCNGGEEYGLYGADGFIRHHPWAEDVRAYLYIDGGPGGPATLLYSGPGTPGLIDAYARAAPHPLTSSAYLDLIESALLSHDGDHRPFRDHNVPGLVFAPIGDMWAPHTMLDRYARVQPGTLQHLGESVLQVTRELANAPELMRAIEPERSIYFDVLGAFVVHYRAPVGVMLALLCTVLAVLAVRRARVSLRDLLRASFAAFVCAVCAVVASLASGVVLAFVLQRGHGWYASPWIVYPAFIAPACAAIFAGQRALARRSDQDQDQDQDRERALWATWCAYLGGWTTLALVAAIAHARSGYLPLLWSAGLGAGLLAALRWPARRRGIALLAIAPGLYGVLQLGPLLCTMCAQMGLQPLPFPADPVLAMLCGALVATASAALALPVHALGESQWPLRSYVVLAVAGVVLSASTFPFTPERPRRVLVTQGAQADRSAYLLRARDVLPLEPVLAQLPAARPARADWTSFEVFEPAPTHELPAPAPDFPLPSAALLSQVVNDDGTRSVELQLRSATPNLRMFVQAGRVVRWSIHPQVAEPPLAGGRATVYFQGFPPEGRRITLTLRGAEPAELELIATTFMPSPELKQMAAAFPAWALPVPLLARSLKLKL